MLRAFGAEIVYSDPMEGSDGAIRLVRQMVADEPARFFYTNQYGNPSNPRAHYLHTAEEIIRELGTRLTHFVAGVGTSGTVMGTGRRLREHSDRIQIVGVEPDDEFHGLEGLKFIETSIVPDIYDRTVLHRTIFVETDRGWNVSERLADEEGLLVGHSAGAAVAAAMMIADELALEGKSGVIACVLPDHASRYLEVKA
jgi:cysteine synthase B